MNDINIVAAIIVSGLCLIIGVAIGRKSKSDGKQINALNAEISKLQSVQHLKAADYEKSIKAEADKVATIHKQRNGIQTQVNEALGREKALKTQIADLKKRNAVLVELSESEIVTLKDESEANKGYALFRGSDARLRAIKKVVPKTTFNQMAKSLNKAIGEGVFDKWSNQPAPIKLKK